MPTANWMRPMTLATATRIVVHRPWPINTGGIHPTVDETTVGRHLRLLVATGTRQSADATIAGPASPPRSRRDDDRWDDGRSGYDRNRREPPPPATGGIVGAATRSRGRHLVRVRVLRHAQRMPGTGTVLMITTAEEMVYEIGTGIADVDEDVYSLRGSPLRVRVVPFCLICLSPYC